MRWITALVALGVLLPPRAARAEEPSGALALVSGGGVNLAAFVVGAALLGTSHGSNAQNNAGWLTIETGFTLAPVAAHAVVNEWVRGLVFAVSPGAALATTGGLFAAEPGAVEHGTLPQQRWMWALFGVGLFSSAAGVADAILAPSRSAAVSVTPLAGFDRFGLQLGGTL
jgi:hypothetical protein